MDDALDRIVSEEEFYKETLEVYDKFLDAFDETYKDLKFCRTRIKQLEGVLYSGELPFDKQLDMLETLKWTVGYETILKNNLTTFIKEIEAMEEELLGSADMTRRN